MKRLLILLPILLMALSMYGANPSYDAFVGTNGIIITTNPPQGRVVVDGSRLTNSLVDVITNRYATANIFTNFGGLFQSGDLTLPGVSGNVLLETSATGDVEGIISRFLARNFFAMNITNILAADGISIGTNTGALWITNTASGSGSGDAIWTNTGSEVFIIFHTNRLRLTTNEIYGEAVRATLTNTVLGFKALSANTGRNNVAIGTNAMGNSPSGYEDVAIGDRALERDTSSGGENVAVGFLSMRDNISGYHNTAIGHWAYREGLIGFQNVAVGKSALGGNTNGSDNVSIGFESMFINDNGSSNTAIGSRTLQLGSIGGQNTVVGEGAMRANLTGHRNVGIGNLSMIGVEAGPADNDNTAVGFGSGIDVLGGKNNLFLGSLAGASAASSQFTNVIVIGAGAKAWTNNMMVLGTNITNYVIRNVAYNFPSVQGAAGTVLTNDGTGVLGWGAGSSGLAGTTNFFNLSVQAAKLPATNYPSIDGGWQAWETVYAETNAEGARVNLDASWQFMVPPDYGTNSLKLLINYSLLQTNGPNTSNVVWGASVLVIRSGTTNNVHTNLFGSVVKGSNDWIAKYDGTNIVTNLVIDLGVNSLLMARDLAVIKLERRPTEDTYGGAVSVHGLQVEYTRP